MKAGNMKKRHSQTFPPNSGKKKFFKQKSFFIFKKTQTFIPESEFLSM
jgi:hypothetical protein